MDAIKHRLSNAPNAQHWQKGRSNIPYDSFKDALEIIDYTESEYCSTI